VQVTICGGGNAAHALAGLLAARQGLRVNVYTPFSDEARRWQLGMARNHGICVRSRDGTIVGRPHWVSANAEEVVPGSQLILLALPAFAHQTILADIAGHLDEAIWVGALAARGAFDLCAKEILDGGARLPILFGLQTLPWACRIQKYGQEVEILGTKAVVDLAAWPPQHASDLASRLSDLLDVPILATASFLSLTLAGTGQIIHPGIMFGLFHQWNGPVYQDAPLFYHAVDEFTVAVLEQLSVEVRSVGAALQSQFHELDLSAVRPLLEWFRRAYHDDIEDPSTLRTCILSNRSYAGLKAPMRPANGGLAPDFQARYLGEDVPYGLIVTRGLAELVGIATPVMDKVITWAQGRLGRVYLAAGKLQGSDIGATRAPQRYGYHDLNSLMQTFYL